jgi:membrane-associated phospholipid phosphatase
VAWVRELSEAPARRSIDVAKLVAAVSGLVVVAVGAHAQTHIDVSFFAPVNQLTDDLEGIAKVALALGSPWVILVVAAAFAGFRHLDVAWRTAVVGGLAWAGAEVFHEVLGSHSTSGLGVDVRVGDGPIFPATNVAIATALLIAVSPYVVRPLRRILGATVVAIAVATMYLGVGLPSDVLGGVLLGMVAAGLVALAAGTTSGKPSLPEVRAALVDLGAEPTAIGPSRLAIPAATIVEADLGSGDDVLVTAFGRDQRDAQVAAKAWHRLMYREPGTTVLGSRVQHVEHIAYAMLLAERAGSAITWATGSTISCRGKTRTSRRMQDQAPVRTPRPTPTIHHNILWER